MSEGKMVGWHHQLDGHELEQAPGVGDRQGSLACCSPWGRKESDMTEQLNWNSSRAGLFFDSSSTQTPVDSCCSIFTNRSALLWLNLRLTHWASWWNHRGQQLHFERVELVRPFFCIFPTFLFSFALHCLHLTGHISIPKGMRCGGHLSFFVFCLLKTLVFTQGNHLVSPEDS